MSNAECLPGKAGGSPIILVHGMSDKGLVELETGSLYDPNTDKLHKFSEDGLKLMIWNGKEWLEF